MHVCVYVKQSTPNSDFLIHHKRRHGFLPWFFLYFNPGLIESFAVIYLANVIPKLSSIAHGVLLFYSSEIIEENPSLVMDLRIAFKFS